MMHFYRQEFHLTNRIVQLCHVDLHKASAMPPKSIVPGDVPHATESVQKTTYCWKDSPASPSACLPVQERISSSTVSLVTSWLSVIVFMIALTNWSSLPYWSNNKLILSWFVTVLVCVRKSVPEAATQNPFGSRQRLCKRHCRLLQGPHELGVCRL